MFRENLFIYHNKTSNQSLLYDKYSSKKYVIPSEVAKRINENKFTQYDNSNIDKLLSNEPIKAEKSKELKHLRLLLTNKCNFKCIYCYANDGSYNLDSYIDMSIETAKKTIDYFYEKYPEIHQISFFGGEPLLNKQAIEFTCEYIEKLIEENKITKMPMFSMVTNGYCIDSQILSIIKKYDIKMVVSIDGPEEIQNLQRPLNSGLDTYNKVCENLIKLRKIGPFSIESTYTKLSEDKGITRDDIRDYLAKKFNVNRIIVNSASSYSANPKDDNRYQYSPEKKLDYVAYFNKFFSTYPYVFDDTIIRLINIFRTPHYNEQFCDAGISQFTVMMNGDIYPCQIYIGEETKILGNVFNEKDPKSMDGVCQTKKQEKCAPCGDKRFCQMCLKNNPQELDCSNLKQGLEIFFSNLSNLYLNDRDKYDELMFAYNSYANSIAKDYIEAKLLEINSQKMTELKESYLGKCTEIISLYETEDSSYNQILGSKIDIPNNAYKATAESVSIDSKFLIYSLIRCKKENKGIAIIHNHGNGHMPSPKDSDTENAIVKLGKKIGIKYIHFVIYDMASNIAGIRTHYLGNIEDVIKEAEIKSYHDKVI
ncbi:MAG: radical SAM protein [Clostridia bacterium]